MFEHKDMWAVDPSFAQSKTRCQQRTHTSSKMQRPVTQKIPCTHTLLDFVKQVIENELCTVCEAVGHAKRYYGGQVKSHKCQFGGTTDRTRVLPFGLE